MLLVYICLGASAQSGTNSPYSQYGLGVLSDQSQGFNRGMSGLGYGLLEVLWRGHTHWSMLLCGGLCLSLMYLVSSMDIHFLLKVILSAAIITWVEFTAGCLINLRLGWQVWDYSYMPGNIMGQICPQFCLLWLGLSAPGLYLCSLIRNLLFKASAE